MRRQNPPQIYLDRALEIEKYLRPIAIASVYVIAGICYCMVVSLIFGVLINDSMLNPTPATITLFAILGFVPAALLFLAPFLRPHDPLSSYVTELANSCRRPLSVTPDDCTFKVPLVDGETLFINLGFYYPLKDHTSDVREKLYTVVHGALTSAFYARPTAPTPREIDAVLSAPLELLADERHIPVLYSEIRDAYHSHGENLESSEYLSTGTYGS
jgi:hypothetical protein